MGTKYRVLALDGGGSWALIEVKALMQLFAAGAETKGWEVLREFDLVAANSGGSIVLGCLIENFTLDEILKFFLSEEQRRAVFSKTDNIGYQMLEEVAGAGPKYSAAKKLPALRKVLQQRGDLPLCDAVRGIAGQSGDDVRVVIVGFDYDRLRARFFRSQETSSKASGTGVATELTLAEAIHASSNAPVNYFDAPATYMERPERYWDGAITGCNNPVLAGVTEAIAATKQEMEIVALSIGTMTCAAAAAAGRGGFAVRAAAEQGRAAERCEEAGGRDPGRSAGHGELSRACADPQRRRAAGERPRGQPDCAHESDGESDARCVTARGRAPGIWGWLVFRSSGTWRWTRSSRTTWRRSSITRSCGSRTAR